MSCQLVTGFRSLCCHDSGGTWLAWDDVIPARWVARTEHRLCRCTGVWGIVGAEVCVSAQPGSAGDGVAMARQFDAVLMSAGFKVSGEARSGTASN